MRYKGIEVTSKENCGHSPKKKLLLDLFRMIAEDQLDRIGEHVTENICWKIVGCHSLQGKKEVIDRVIELKKLDITEIKILNIITHGNVAAVNGVINKKTDTLYEFCNVYTFKSAGKHIIKDIVSYVIKTC